MNETERHWRRELADQACGAIREQRAGLRELEDVGPQHRADVDVAERRRAPWLTTRIISSGVMPLAASAATNEPALVPT